MNLENLNRALQEVNKKLLASARGQNLEMVNLTKAQAAFNELVFRAIKDLSDGQSPLPPQNPTPPL